MTAKVINTFQNSYVILQCDCMVLQDLGTRTQHILL